MTVPYPYDKKQGQEHAELYRSMIKKIPANSPRYNIDDNLYVEEGMFKNWEEVDAAYFWDGNKTHQKIPEIHGNKSMMTIQTPSASLYFKKKYFKGVAETAGWTPTFQKAVTLLLINKCIQIASIERLTKFANIYGVNQDNGDGTFTYDEKGERVGTEINHYRANWYGANVGIPNGGIMELTNFTNFTTDLTIHNGEIGSASITIDDPYNILYVTKKDIDDLFEPVQDIPSNIADKMKELQDNIDHDMSWLRSPDIHCGQYGQANWPPPDINLGPPESLEEVQQFEDAMNLISKEQPDCKPVMDNFIEMFKHVWEMQQLLNTLKNMYPSAVNATGLKLKTGEELLYKMDVDIMYNFLVGRSIFSALDEVYLWVSFERESLSSANMIEDLQNRIKEIQEQKKRYQASANMTKEQRDELQKKYDDCKAKVDAAKKEAAKSTGPTQQTNTESTPASTPVPPPAVNTVNVPGTGVELGEPEQ